MAINQPFIAELKYEAEKTKKMLAAIPYDKATWKPHPKSMELGKLALHVVDMTRWASVIVTSDELDFQKPYFEMPAFDNAAALSAKLDSFVAQAVSDLEKADDACMNGNWSLRNGDHVFFTLPRHHVLRDMVFNHIIHHRAQLGVYLRLLDGKVPGMYGPSADDK